jgi:hypothetical protein
MKSTQTNAAPNPFLEAVATTFIDAAGKLSMEQILQKAIDKNKTKGKALIKSGKVFAEGLNQFALETNTKIDDALASCIGQACDNVAKANNISI